MYYGSASGRNLTYWLFKDRIPVTKSVIVANIVSSVLIGVFQVGAVGRFLAFEAARFPFHLWTGVTYALCGSLDVIALLFSCYWMWIAGGSLERGWGSEKFGVYFLATTAITALGMFLGAVLLHMPTELAGLWLPLAGVTVAWAMRDPEQQILFFFVIPMKLKYLALIDVAIVLYYYHVPLGLFALAGCLFSYLYIRRQGATAYQSYGSPYQPYRSDTRERIIRIYPRKYRNPFAGFDPLKWYRDYKDRKRLEKFLGK